MKQIKHLKEVMSELGKRGGKVVLSKFGKKHFRKMAKIGQDNRRERLKISRSKGTHTRTEWNKLIKEFDNRCVRCGKTPLRITKDHIITICQEGSDGIDNIQPLCKCCNSQKGLENTNWVAYRRLHGWNKK